MGTVDMRLQPIARKQYGRVTRAQLADVGVSRATVARRLAAETWSESLPGVIDLATHTPSWRGRVLEAVLACGPASWASHDTAGHLHRFLDLHRPTAIDVTVLRARRRCVEGIGVHTTRAIADDEVTERHGIPCTTPARTLLDLAATTAPDELERWAADLARRDRGVLDELTAVLDRHRRSPGRRRLLDVIARLPAGVAELGSPLEVLGVQELVRLQAPAFEVQYTVRDRAGARVKRVDVAWPALRVLVEFDGAAYHDLSAAKEADARTRERLRALGWTVVVVRRADLGGTVLPGLVRDLQRRAVESAPHGRASVASV